MKFLGLDISFHKNIDEKVTIRQVQPTSIPVARIPLVNVRPLSYAQSYAGGRGLFTAPEYDLSEIGKVEDIDGYLRQSFRKKEGLMFKEGFGYQGANKDTLQYIKNRMAQIARASDIPTIILLKRIGRSLIRISNAFIIKVRKAEASGGRARTNANGRQLEPVAAYFPVAPEMMKADLDENTGRIRGWRQTLPDGRYKDYPVNDVIHFHTDRREGFLFGIPTAIPVLDDIRALRQIEENIEMLIYQNLFPIFHYKVGTETAPAGWTEDGRKEVDVVAEQIKYMPSEGALVTPERHEITAIGSEGRALRAEGYLTHFKKRIFAGLGVSAVDLGEGDTSNRSTAFTLSRALIDNVKAIQDELEAQWDQYIISELLLESTFDEKVLDDENTVHIQFAEIDIQNKIDLEKHYMELFKSYGLTYDEYRSALSREPIALPENGEDQDPAKYPEWFSTYWKLIEEPMKLISAVDEPFSVPSQAASEARSTSLTAKALITAQQTKEKEAAAQSEADTKTKIAVARIKGTRHDNYLHNAFKNLEEDISQRLLYGLNNKGVIDIDALIAYGYTWATDITDKIYSILIADLIQGFTEQVNIQQSIGDILILSVARKALYNRTHNLINRLANNTITLMSRRIDENIKDVKLEGAEEDILQELRLAFDATKYRTTLIWDTERQKAHVYGCLLGLRYLGQYGIQLVAHKDGCDKCQFMNRHIILSSEAGLDNVPPLHPNSRMMYKIIRNIEDIK